MMLTPALAAAAAAVRTAGGEPDVTAHVTPVRARPEGSVEVEPSNTAGRGGRAREEVEVQVWVILAGPRMTAVGASQLGVQAPTCVRSVQCMCVGGGGACRRE